MSGVFIMVRSGISKVHSVIIEVKSIFPVCGHWCQDGDHYLCKATTCCFNDGVLEYLSTT